MKIRVDQLLVTRGLAVSRPRAQALVLAGKVYVGQVRIEKAGALLAEETELTLRGDDHAFVSRGGVKLEGALDTFGVDANEKRCIDLGASTGGFTDCLLQRGASSVAAVDVGYGQLAHKLRTDPRVLVLERTNARTLEPEHVGGLADLIVVDASFIGLAKLLPAIVRCMRDDGELVALVKPQFEVGRKEASRSNGVVRDPLVRATAIARVTEEIEKSGLHVLASCDCSIEGPKGNREAFVHARKLRRDNEVLVPFERPAD